MDSFDWNPAELLALSGGYWSTCALHAGVRLGLFPALAAQPRTVAELAEEKGIPQRGLVMLLDALTAMQLLEKSSERYLMTPSAARYLDPASPEYLGHIIAHHHHLMSGWTRLDEAVRSGGPIRERVSHDADEEQRENFLLGMFDLGMLLAPRVAAAIDLSGRQQLLDLGGGPGTYAIHFCWRNPQLRATIFDLPTTRPFAEKTLTRFDMSSRIDFVQGDFTVDPIPDGCDVAWLSHVLHAEGRGGCAALLRKTAAALEPGGLLLVQEFILRADRTGPLFPALFSLNMLLGTPEGQAYSEPELTELLSEAGFRQIERLPLELPNGVGILSAVKS